MNFRFLFVLTFTLLTSIVFAGNQGVDTVHIQNIDIVAPRLQHFSSAEKHIQVDSLTINRYDGKDLANLLQKISLVNVSSNGSLGALSTVSMRGASAVHTSVNWNGIPVNSLTTGAADLSLIDAGAFDQVEVVYGATGSLYGSGTLGGAIELSNTPQWNKTSSIGVSTEAGSFSNYKVKLRGRYSNNWLAYSGQAYFKYGKNDFTYTDFYDHGHPKERSNHNENRAYGTIQDLHFKLQDHYVDLGFWYQVKDKNIAGLMGFGEPVSSQNQRDSSLRVYTGWKHLFGKVRLEAKSAYIYDYLKYTNNIISEIFSERWLNDFNFRWYASDELSVDANLKYNWLKGKTSNYGEDKVVSKIENEEKILVAAKYSPDIGIFILTWSKEWNSEVNPPNMYSLSALLHLVPQVIDFRIKSGTHYRRPTFNDRYWVPGGNINLEAEEGWNFELGTILLAQKIGRGILNVDLNLYRAENENSIAWKPDGSEWSAVNTGKILSQGAEIETNYLLTLGKSNIRTMLKYGYNDAYYNDKGSDNYKDELAYRPHHIGKFAGDFIRSKWDAGVICTYRSDTKTWEDKTVDGNFLVDLNAGFRFKTQNVNVKLSGRIENLFDKSYELVRFYPMPGRAYYIGADLTF